MIRKEAQNRKWFALGIAATALTACGALAAADAKADRARLPTPAGIVAKAAPGAWIEIKAEDLLVMDLPPLAAGAGSPAKPRRVIVQLMPAPFSQGWVGNIRKLAAAHWWDGTAIVRVQDNYVTQWGDPDGEDKAKAKPLPKDLATVPESAYVVPSVSIWAHETPSGKPTKALHAARGDAYAEFTQFANGWPIASDHEKSWPLHCYGAVGVGRNLSPDTGNGAELYTVIGHAPRQLDRNIAVVGRVISGMEWLSSLPRGTGDLGFYKTPQERTPITSVRLASELPAASRPRFEYMNTESEVFAQYRHLRANRSDSFYNVPAGGVDICNVPVPVRAAGGQ